MLSTYKILEKGVSEKDLAAKYGVPKALSTLLTIEKLVDALDNVKRPKLNTGNNELVDKAVFDWFLSMRSQKNTFVKELDVENFLASDNCYNAGRKETT